MNLILKRLTIPMVDTFIADLKDAVREAKVSPSGKGTMVALYGMSSAPFVMFNLLSHLYPSFVRLHSSPLFFCCRDL